MGRPGSVVPVADRSPEALPCLLLLPRLIGRLADQHGHRLSMTWDVHNHALFHRLHQASQAGFGCREGQRLIDGSDREAMSKL